MLKYLLKDSHVDFKIKISPTLSLVEKAKVLFVDYPYITIQSLSDGEIYTLHHNKIIRFYRRRTNIIWRIMRLYVG